MAALAVEEDEMDIDAQELSEQDLESDDEEQQPAASMAYVKDEEFPMFLTIKRLILMIDATLDRPFFARSLNNQIIGMSTNSEWHNEMKGIMQINKEYKRQRRQNLFDVTEQDLESSSDEEDDYNVDIEENEEMARAAMSKLVMRRNKLKKGVKESGMSFEVDYEYFERHFWPSMIQRTRFDPLLVWTEIQSYIKGSSSSYSYVGMYLTKREYANMGRKKSLLSHDEKESLWDIFIEYERWKVRLGAYDFQDVVNYILYQISFYGYQGVPLHFMMIDEVQDLTHATLLLLLRVTEQNLFFSGDTAQTIAKGVGFRFCDLRSLFTENMNKGKFTIPEIKQLTVNFRSHGKILDLANTVISLVECLFPETIDKLAKERSESEGPMPTIVNSSNNEHLFYLLFGQDHAAEGTGESKPSIEFGCNQVVIVRNQESKKHIPALLQHALCLTIYEVKGLEFEDVILYNFFTESPVEHQWKILAQIQQSEDYSGHREGPQSFESMKQTETKFVCTNRNFETTKYSLLCTELKQLYVAITRPRQRLIIFDEDPMARQPMENFWNEMGVVNSINFVESPTGLHVEGQSDIMPDIQGIATSTSARAWKVQGIKMMKHRYYSQAMKCFKNSGDAHLEERATAYNTANEASRKLAEADSALEQKKVLGLKPNKNDKRAARQAKDEAKIDFGTAGQQFETLGLLKHAAKCYFSSDEYIKAGELFEQVQCWAQAAEAFLSVKKYKKAAEDFGKAGEYNRAIDCYALLKDWDTLLSTINKFSNKMSREERESLIKKYIPLALEQLMPKVVPVRDEEIIYSKQFEAQIKEESDEEDSSDEEMPQVPEDYYEGEMGTLTNLIVDEGEEEDEYHRQMESRLTTSNN